jgi:hypothetical protein
MPKAIGPPLIGSVSLNTLFELQEANNAQLRRIRQLVAELEESKLIIRTLVHRVRDLEERNVT